MSETNKTVFISYRRDVSSFIARAVFMDLRSQGYDVFMDVESIDSGTFDAVILNQIAARANFVLILTPGSLERCSEPDDWLRHEIETAIDLERNIVPLLINNFSFKEAEPFLTGKLKTLSRFNALNVPHDYFDAAMEKLRTRFFKQPFSGTILTTPSNEQDQVQQKIEDAAKLPAPTVKELTAEEYLKQGNISWNRGDHEAAISNYNEAIRLNPQYPKAYYNRGIVNYDKGNIEDTIEDFTEAIRRDPSLIKAYEKLIKIYETQGNLEETNTHYSKLIEIYSELLKQSQDADNYMKRAIAHYHKGDYDKAIDDYTEFIRLIPADTYGYSNRAEAYFGLEDYHSALLDFQKASELDPNNIHAIAGLAITYYALGKSDEAIGLWLMLVNQDEHYRETEWLKSRFSWKQPLVEEVRKLIVQLD